MAAIHSLPIELVARIFAIGVQDQGEPDAIEVGAHRFEVLVSHVCQYWRQTALSTPSLWTTIFFRSVPHMTRAREYLIRSKEHLLDIDVDTCSEKEHEAGYTLFRKEFTQVFDIVVPHIDRWRSLTLKVRDLECKAGARHVLSRCGPANHLERLKLWHIEDWGTAERLYTAIGPPPVVVFNGSLPSLRSISLIGVNLPWVNSPFLKGLTSIELALHSDEVRIPYNLWYTMLSQSPELVELSLHYSGPKLGATGGIEWSNEKIHLPRLRQVKLRDMDNPTYFQLLFQRLRMPKVKVLSLETPSDQDFTPFIEYLANPHRDEANDDDSSHHDHSRSTSPEPNVTVDDVPESSASPTSDIHPYAHSHSSTHSPSPFSPSDPSHDPSTSRRRRRTGPVFPLLEELTIEKLYCSAESWKTFLLSASQVRYLDVDPSNMGPGLFDELSWKGVIPGYEEHGMDSGIGFGMNGSRMQVAGQGVNGSNSVNGSNGPYVTPGVNGADGVNRIQDLHGIHGVNGSSSSGTGVGGGMSVGIGNGMGQERTRASPYAEDSVDPANGAYPASYASYTASASSTSFLSSGSSSSSSYSPSSSAHRVHPSHSSHLSHPNHSSHPSHPSHPSAGSSDLSHHHHHLSQSAHPSRLTPGASAITNGAQTNGANDVNLNYRSGVHSHHDHHDHRDSYPSSITPPDTAMMETETSNSQRGFIAHSSVNLSSSTSSTSSSSSSFQSRPVPSTSSASGHTGHTGHTGQTNGQSHLGGHPPHLVPLDPSASDSHSHSSTSHSAGSGSGSSSSYPSHLSTATLDSSHPSSRLSHSHSHSRSHTSATTYPPHLSLSTTHSTHSTHPSSSTPSHLQHLNSYPYPNSYPNSYPYPYPPTPSTPSHPLPLPPLSHPLTSSIPLPRLQTVRLRGLEQGAIRGFVLHRRELSRAGLTWPVTKWVLEERLRGKEMLGWMREVGLWEVNPPRVRKVSGSVVGTGSTGVGGVFGGTQAMGVGQSGHGSFPGQGYVLGHVVEEEDEEERKWRDLEWDGPEWKERIEWFKDEDEEEEEEVVEYDDDEEGDDDDIEEDDDEQVDG